jgi:hypothetical protein
MGDSCVVEITGDINVDGGVTSADIICLVNFIFLRGDCVPEPCRGAADVNCNAMLTSSDVIYLVNYVFKGGVAPCDACTMIPDPWPCPD